MKDLGERLAHSDTGKLITAIFGTAIYAFGMNFFIVPLGLYSGGMMGIAQLLRTFLSSVPGISFGSFDVAGVFYYVLNIPMCIMAYKMMDGGFVKRMIITVSTSTLFLSIIPVLQTPLVEDELTGCLMGGIICGFGCGIYLRAGCSGGGFEVIGINLTRKMRDFSVGRMNMMVNAVIYALCLLLFDHSIAVYSIIYSVVMALAMDKVHSQNIRVEAIILSKTNNDVIEQQILEKLSRGITCWKAQGGFTGETVDVLYTVLSKYEIGTLKQIVYTANPQAFMVVKEGLSVDGNFIKRI